MSEYLRTLYPFDTPTGTNRYRHFVSQVVARTGKSIAHIHSAPEIGSGSYPERLLPGTSQSRSFPLVIGQGNIYLDSSKAFPFQA